MTPVAGGPTSSASSTFTLTCSVMAHHGHTPKVLGQRTLGKLVLGCRHLAWASPAPLGGDDPAVDEQPTAPDAPLHRWAVGVDDLAAPAGGTAPVVVTASSKPAAAWVSRTHQLLKGGRAMGFGTSLFLIAVGAILTFAVEVDAEGLNLDAVGVILMIVGAVGLIASVIYWNTWGGFSRRRRVVQEDAPGTGPPPP